MSVYIPVIIVVLSNTIYHICAKSAPKGINTFASLSVTYFVGMIFSVVLYFFTRKQSTVLADYRALNWTSAVLGLAVVGLEAGFLLMYKVGWDISKGQLVASALLAIVLVVVGYFAFKEAVTVQKALGIIVCFLGLYLLSK